LGHNPVTGDILKMIDLTLWILVIFLIPGSFAQLTQTSETPTQGAFETGFNQPPLGTETPTQQTYSSGVNQTLPGDQTPTPVAQKTVLPGITIISPNEGSTIPSGNVTVTVNVTNFTLVNMLGAKNVPGEGHLHYYMDVPVPTTPGKPAITAVGTFTPTYSTTWTWPNITLGKHNFSVQLANNDHTPVIPLVYATVNVTVT
jgi:hypothetical protein